MHGLHSTRGMRLGCNGLARCRDRSRPCRHRHRQLTEPSPQGHRDLSRVSHRPSNTQRFKNYCSAITTSFHRPPRQGALAAGQLWFPAAALSRQCTTLISCITQCPAHPSEQATLHPSPAFDPVVVATLLQENGRRCERLRNSVAGDRSDCRDAGMAPAPFVKHGHRCHPPPQLRTPSGRRRIQQAAPPEPQPVLLSPPITQRVGFSERITEPLDKTASSAQLPPSS